MSFPRASNPLSHGMPECNDYHRVIKARLRALAHALEDATDQPVVWRACVDTAPLLERDYAAAGGLGFIAKSTMLITPGVGSYTLLGELLVRRTPFRRPQVSESDAGARPNVSSIAQPRRLLNPASSMLESVSRIGPSKREPVSRLMSGR